LKKISVLLLALMIFSLVISACQSQPRERQTPVLIYPSDPTTRLKLVFSTYIGGSKKDELRDIVTDRQGNIYITGGTVSSDFPTTSGAFQTIHKGDFDVFVMKLDPNGKVIWSTLIGGPKHDRAYAIKVDNQGYVYIAGRAGPGFPVTSGAFQTQFQGYGGGYGPQNAFVAKLKPDGSGLVWASYFGVASMIRDFDIDKDGNIYIESGYSPGKSPNTIPSAWVANAFQKTPPGGEDVVVAKIKSDGSQVLWATYLGGSGKEDHTASLRVDNSNYVYVLLYTQSTDMPVSLKAYDRTYNGGEDYFLAKLTPDGSNLVFGTYLGGSKNEIISTHNLALDAQGNAYIIAWTSSPDFPTTPGAFQRTYRGGFSDVAVSKISSDGTQLLASTFIGGSDGENAESIAMDLMGNIYFSGETNSTDFPVTADAFQRNNAGKMDGFLVKLSPDFNKLLYSTYMGGSDDDASRSSTLDANGNFFFAGCTKSDNFPILNSLQPSRAGLLDIALAKFTPQLK